MGKFLVWIDYYHQFSKYQPFRVSLLKPWQISLNNPEAYQNSFKQLRWIFFFAKIVNSEKPLTFFVEHSTLNV